GVRRTSRPRAVKALMRSADHLSIYTLSLYVAPSAVVTRRLRPPSQPPIPLDLLVSRLVIESSWITVTLPAAAATSLAALPLAMAPPIFDPPPAPINAPRAPGPVWGGKAKLGTATTTKPTVEAHLMTCEWTWASLSG